MGNLAQVTANGAQTTFLGSARPPSKQFRHIDVLTDSTQAPRTKDPEEWITAIKKNPEKFPVLNFFVWLIENHPNSKIKRDMFDEEIKLPLAIGTTVGVATYFVSKKLPLASESISRRRFLNTILSGTGLILVGRSADILSTSKALTKFEEYLNEVQESPAFKRLPPEVQQRIIPPVNSIEANPDQVEQVNERRELKVAAKAIVSETFSFAAMFGSISVVIFGLTSAAYKLFSKLIVEKTPVGRRTFLALSGFMSASSLYVAGLNLNATSHLDNLKPVTRELEELHKINTQ